MAMSTLSLISLAIKDATNRASEETFKNITNSFSMEINMTYQVTINLDQRVEK